MDLWDEALVYGVLEYIWHGQVNGEFGVSR